MSRPNLKPPTPSKNDRRYKRRRIRGRGASSYPGPSRRFAKRHLGGNVALYFRPASCKFNFMTVGQGRILFIDNKWDPEKRADARVASPSPKRQLQGKKKRWNRTNHTISLRFFWCFFTSSWTNHFPSLLLVLAPDPNRVKCLLVTSRRPLDVRIK
jgi:hypothetical protein